MAQMSPASISSPCRRRRRSTATPISSASRALQLSTVSATTRNSWSSVGRGAHLALPAGVTSPTACRSASPWSARHTDARPARLQAHAGSAEVPTAARRDDEPAPARRPRSHAHGGSRLDSRRRRAHERPAACSAQLAEFSGRLEEYEQTAPGLPLLRPAPAARRQRPGMVRVGDGQGGGHSAIELEVSGACPDRSRQLFRGPSTTGAGHRSLWPNSSACQLSAKAPPPRCDDVASLGGSAAYLKTLGSDQGPFLRRGTPMSWKDRRRHGRGQRHRPRVGARTAERRLHGGVAGRRKEELDKTAKMAGDNAQTRWPCRRRRQARGRRRRCSPRRRRPSGRLDLLFNNAGIGAPPVPLEELPFEPWQVGGRRQPDRLVPVHPGGHQDNEGPEPEGRAHHQQRLDLGAHAAAQLGRLHLDQARHHRADQVDLARRAQARHRLRPDRHRQRRTPPWPSA